MIKQVQLKNVRNHTLKTIDFHSRHVYISGSNGSGKTTILESLYFCSTTRSHRTNDEKDLIQYQAPFSAIKVITDSHTYEVVITKEGKRLFIDRQEKRKMSDFLGHLKVVMFSPDDLELIQGSPSYRRQFLDMEWMKLNKGYIQTLNDYKNVLKQRNSLLKRMKIGDDPTFLVIIGQQLFTYGKKIIEARQQCINMLNDMLIPIYHTFRSDSIEIRYEPNVTIEAFKTHLEHEQKQDILYQMTTVGPHRDDFSFYINNNNIKAFASQGEKRMVVLALKLAVLEIIKKHTTDDVIMLLDDVLSELDESNQKIFLHSLPKESQIIMNSAIHLEMDDLQTIDLERNENDE